MFTFSDLSVNPNGKVSQKGVRVSHPRKGPRVLASKKLSKNSVLNRKSSALKKSSTSQSKFNLEFTSISMHVA